MKIEKDDFDAWKDNPVTQEVFRVVAHIAEIAKEKWISDSWGKGEANALVLADLRARAEIAKDLTEMTFEEFTDHTDAMET